MNKSTFNETVKNSVLSSLGENDYSVDLGEVTKNNGVKLDSLIIRKINSQLGVTFYLNGYYNNYENGKENIATITESILSSYLDKRVSGKSFDLDFIKNKENILSKVFYRIVNETRNNDLMTYAPYSKFIDGSDMIVTYAILVEENDEAGIASVLVTNQIMDTYDISMCELMEAASNNTPNSFPVTFQNITQVLSAMMGIDELSIPLEDELPIWVLSNINNLNGASVIMYKKTLQDISNKLHGSFYILPSSVHELLCIPDEGNINPESLYEMVSCVNLTEVGPTDFLSDIVLYYDSKNNLIKTA